MRMMWMVGLLGLAACAEDLHLEMAEDGLTAWAPQGYGGCYDALVYGHNARDSQAFFLDLPGLATDANNLGVPIVIDEMFPAPSGTLRVESGRRLTSATCVGAFPQPGPRVDATYVATSGRLRARVTPTGGGGPLPFAEVDVQLDNVVVEDGLGGSIALPSISLQSVTVGFWPP